MRMLRNGVVLGVTVVLLLVLFSSCIPPRWPKEDVYPYDEPLVIAVTDECTLVDAAGDPVTSVKVEKSTPIKWVNDSQNTAVIEFSSLDVIGRWSIYLNPGESYLTFTRSTMIPGHEYTFRVICKGETTIYGPTPPIEQEPPPGP
ncbi:MAG: hypothetical protein JSW58_07715 [Candidatus Latescibacterota bacterium]|nr:MAG: hypothetical protein JSW58_07715 [Candidatus Latescibacterota bacterium]